MGLTNAYRDLLAAATVGAAYTTFANANAYISVGDSATAFAVSQTDLQAATNKFRKPMDATFPTLAANVLTFKSTFGLSDANFTWAEWGVHNASTAGTMLNRVVQANGTKAGTEVKVVTVTITLGV